MLDWRTMVPRGLLEIDKRHQRILHCDDAFLSQPIPNPFLTFAN
jgi:hypothetical protein